MNDISNNVANKNFSQLFRSNILFEIPFFQRGYAWEKKHWDQLFVDIEEKILIDIDLSDDLEDIEHFFGPIVVLEKVNSDPQLKQFLVIDGQQRISTVYLLLSIIKNLLEEKTHESQQASEHISKLKNYILNDSDDVDDYKKLKVFSTKGDRLPTYYIVFGNQSNPSSPFLQVDQQLFNPQTNKINAFKKYAEKRLRRDFHSVPKLWQLAQIILNCLKVVWIPLDEKKDDPQAIFESLNDRGMPLSASELICNYLFQPLIKSGENHEYLHNNYWLKTVKGIDSKGNFEDYLRNYLTIGEKKVIGKGRRIYVFFKFKHKKINSKTSKEFLNEINNFYSSYNQIINPISNRYNNNDISELLIKINATRMDACNPFLLSILRSLKLETISIDDCKTIINEIYVLLVRRKMSEMPTQKYDIIFPSLLGKIINEPNKAKAVQSILIDEKYYVSNQEFEYALINKPLYRQRDLNFTRMVLQEIDKSMQEYGQLPDYSTLPTIEHILPQNLDKHWKKYLGDEIDNNDLPRYTNTLGNLCLLSLPANSHAGRDPFKLKKQDYTDVSALTRDIKKRNVKWSIEEISNRAKDLSKQALNIWKWAE